MNIESRDGIEPLIGPFGELLTGNQEDDINVSFKYPFYNTSYDLKPAVLDGDGAASVSGSLLNVSSTTGSAIVESKESVRYRTGHSGYINFTASFNGTGVGFVGGFDNEDGFLIKYENGVLSVGYRKAGVDTFVEQDQFKGQVSIDDIDFTKINVFRIVFGYLGVASPTFRIKQGGWKTLGLERLNLKLLKIQHWEVHLHMLM